MAELSLNETLLRFIETFRVCGSFLYSVTDEELEYFLFEKYDDHIIVDLGQDSLNRLFSNGLITADIRKKCSELRELSLSVLENSEYEYSAEFVKSSAAWKQIIEFADSIKTKMQAIYPSLYDFSPLKIK